MILWLEKTLWPDIWPWRPLAAAHRPNNFRQASFSLIELMVVIAIIAILASILMPALSRARMSAKRIGCFNNLKAIYQGEILYDSDYHNLALDNVTFNGQTNSNIYSSTHLFATRPMYPYLGITGTFANHWATNASREKSVYFCPGVPLSDPPYRRTNGYGATTYARPLHHYGNNRDNCITGPFRMHMVRSPAQRVFHFEAVAGWATGVINYPNCQFPAVYGDWSGNWHEWQLYNRDDRARRTFVTWAGDIKSGSRAELEVFMARPPGFGGGDNDIRLWP